MWPNPRFPADLVTFTESILNGKLHFLCSRKGYNFQHVLIRLLEEWGQNLDILLIPKLAAYSVDENLLMYMYLSNRKQCIRINNVHKIVSKMSFLGYLKGPLSSINYLTVSLNIFFISSTKLACIILVM